MKDEETGHVAYKAESRCAYKMFVVNADSKRLNKIIGVNWRRL
jgi:hypothetical protein